MVSKQDIKDYDFKTIEDYFNYIVDSIINGQRQQAKDLIKELSKEQKKEAVKHFSNYNERGFPLNEQIEEAKEMVFNLL